MQIESDSTMVEELHQWGWWAQDCPSRSLNYPSTTNFKESKSSININITDERAMEIDAAIAKIFGKDKDAIKLIKLRFVCGMTYREIGLKTKHSPSGAHKLIDSYIHWLAGYFYGLSESS